MVDRCGQLAHPARRPSITLNRITRNVLIVTFSSCWIARLCPLLFRSDVVRAVCGKSKQKTDNLLPPWRVLSRRRGLRTGILPARRTAHWQIEHHQSNQDAESFHAANHNYKDQFVTRHGFLSNELEAVRAAEMQFIACGVFAKHPKRPGHPKARACAVASRHEENHRIMARQNDRTTSARAGKAVKGLGGTQVRFHPAGSRLLSR